MPAVSRPFSGAAGPVPSHTYEAGSSGPSVISCHILEVDGSAAVGGEDHIAHFIGVAQELADIHHHLGVGDEPCFRPAVAS